MKSVWDKMQEESFAKGMAEGLLKGEKIGMAKGKKQGMAEGLLKGEEKGEKKGEKKMQEGIVLTMLKAGDLAIDLKLSRVKELAKTLA